MKCSHCREDFLESEIEEHHIHPRFMNNKKGDGMKIQLCKKCHDKIHLMIPSIYWNLLNDWQQMEAVEIIGSFTKKYGRLE